MWVEMKGAWVKFNFDTVPSVVSYQNRMRVLPICVWPFCSIGDGYGRTGCCGSGKETKNDIQLEARGHQLKPSIIVCKTDVTVRKQGYHILYITTLIPLQMVLHQMQ